MLKRQAYAEYGITQYKTGDYEVDHPFRCPWEDLIPFVIFAPINQNIALELVRKRCA